MLSRRKLCAAAVFAATAALAGCGGKGGVTVSGVVTYDGSPIPDGRVNLMPAGSKGGAYGGVIVDGKYKVSNVEPGKYQATISVPPPAGAAKPITSYEEARAQTDALNQQRASKQPVKAEKTQDAITADTPGNAQVIDVGDADTTQDFALRKKK